MERFHYKEAGPQLLMQAFLQRIVIESSTQLMELGITDTSVVQFTGETIKAQNRPIVIITSNNEKELPDAFLRRCFFHYIRFPDAETMAKIVEVHFPGLKQSLLREALSQFYELREAPGLKKKSKRTAM